MLEISKSLLHVTLRTDFGNACWILVSSAFFHPWDLIEHFFLLRYLVKRRLPEVATLAASL